MKQICWKYFGLGAISLWKIWRKQGFDISFSKGGFAASNPVNPGRNVQIIISRSSKPHVPFVGCFSYIAREQEWYDQGFQQFNRKNTWNVSLHSRNSHPRNALGIHRGVPDLETVIIPREIGKKGPLVIPLCSISEASPLWWVKRLDKNNRTEWENKVVIGGALWREHFDRIISWGIWGSE